MSASIMLHGPFKAGARFVNRQDSDVPAFVSLDINAEGASASLLDVSSDDLDSLMEAIAAARKVLPS